MGPRTSWCPLGTMRHAPLSRLTRGEIPLLYTGPGFERPERFGGHVLLFQKTFEALAQTVHGSGGRGAGHSSTPVASRTGAAESAPLSPPAHRPAPPRHFQPRTLAPPPPPGSGQWEGRADKGGGACPVSPAAWPSGQGGGQGGSKESGGGGAPSCWRVDWSRGCGTILIGQAVDY